MKKLTSLLLSTALAAGLFTVPVSAAASEFEMIQAVNALGIMLGDENGDMMLDRPVNRAEFITMAVKTIPNGDRIGAGSFAPYSDVPSTSWAAPYVEAGKQYGLVAGFTDGTFRPESQITLAEGFTIATKILGYLPTDFQGGFPTAQMSMAHKLGLDEDMTVTQANDILTRGDSMQLFYNLLTASTRQGGVYLERIGYLLTQTGEVDLLALINGTMDGPVIADANWESEIGFPLEQATVYFNGDVSDIHRVEDYDVVYWSDTMKTLWVYRDRVVGTIQTITNSAPGNPGAVTVAGQTVQISGSSAAYELSNLGKYGVGDMVTLLLGRDGTVVGVTDSTSVTTTRIGILTSKTQDDFADSNGSYTADTISIQATDGKIYRYSYSSNYIDVGELVRVTTDKNGAVSVDRVQNTNLSGTVSNDGATLGKHTFASDVEILDVYADGAKGVVTHRARLAGVKLDQSDISGYALNNHGEISHLLLNDVTGDNHEYGIITHVEKNDYDLNMYTIYQMVIQGQSQVAQLSGVRYTTNKVPVQIEGSIYDIQGIKDLKSMDIDSVSANIAVANDKQYLLSDMVQIYLLDGGDYYVSNAERVNAMDATLTAYYDAPQEDGGRIRVILAKEN